MKQEHEITITSSNPQSQNEFGEDYYAPNLRK